MDLDRLAGLLDQQADACAELGSPMYAALLHRVARETRQDGPVRRVLGPHADASGPAATGLRLLGAVHRLVLQGRAAGLAPYYPSVGGSWDVDAAWPAFVGVLDELADDVAAGMRRPPQTNEVGRAAALAGGLLRLVPAGPGLPVRLYELGASAGLNLRFDHFHYAVTDGGWGPRDSPVRLEPAWCGTPTPLDRALEVVERVGCDPDPVDPASAEGRLVLASYVWPDQGTRLARLRGACRVAAAVPATVRRQRAVDLVASIAPAEGALTVLWHSVVWQYLGTEEKDAVRAEVRRLGAAATDRGPFAHLSLEPRRRQAGARHDFLVVAQAWPGGVSQVLGEAPGHGVPVDWER